ncbi:hypothetical protein [Dactylosporangium sp. CA-139066]|uniref:hypothetical protein n=1 Tax=Dactylosporangium sp. CA-139066 TaxID=3239930 RepID=UPI003D905849
MSHLALGVKDRHSGRLGERARSTAVKRWSRTAGRHLRWTLREPAIAMANWRRLLRPGGRLVAVDGFWFTGGDDGPPLFAEHYTAGTRAALPFMQLDGPEPTLAAAVSPARRPNRGPSSTSAAACRTSSPPPAGLSEAT